jgi:hypothetical protein
VLEVWVRVDAGLPHFGHVRRQGVVSRHVPVVEDIVDDFRYVLDATGGIRTSLVDRRGCYFGLGESDSGMLEEDGLEK